MECNTRVGICNNRFWEGETEIARWANVVLVHPLVTPCSLTADSGEQENTYYISQQNLISF